MPNRPAVSTVVCAAVCAVVCAAVCAVVSPLLAQEQTRDTVRAEPIVVTATRIPLSQSSLPVAVTVITRADLEIAGIKTVSDALGDLSSAYITQSGSPGSVTGLHLRGGESKYVKVLVDGVPVNDPGGAYDFGSLTTDNIDRVEIVRGPASVIYGADAVTGVVNVITRAGGGMRAELEVRGGGAPREKLGAKRPDATQLWDISALTSGTLTSGTYSLSVARHQSTGLYELNNHYLNNVFSGRMSFAPSATTDVRFSLRYNDYRFNYPTNGGGTAVDSNAIRSEDRTVLGAEIEHSIMPDLRAFLTLSSSVNDGGTDDQRDQAAGSSFVSQDKIRRRGAELRFQFTPARAAATTVGVQLEQQDQRSQSLLQSAFGDFAGIFRAARRNAAAYSELTLTPTSRVTATLGARIDDNEQFGQFGTGRAGISWRPLSATRVRATVGNAFREPSFFENYSTGFVIGNPALRPERTTSVDAGVEQQLLAGRAQLSVTGFVQRFRNMIDYTGDTSACGFNYCNVAAARANGIEVELGARVYGPFNAAISGTILDTRVLSPGFDTTVFATGLYRTGEQLIRRPRMKWTADLTYRDGTRLSASARLIAVGKRTDRDFRPFPNQPVVLRAYERFDLAADYAFLANTTRRSSMTLRVENLGNTGYQNIFNFLAPRRTIWVGVRSIL